MPASQDIGDHGFSTCIVVAVTISSFVSYHEICFVLVTRRVSIMEQELLTLQEHLI